MNLGLVARADDRGIGYVSLSFYEAMRPARTLVVREPGAERRGFAPHLDRYPDAAVVTYDGERGTLSEAMCREFLDGLDVCYMVETPYDFRFFQWARDARCVTVLHAMPEFWRWHTDPDVPRPDVWWLPTSWRADTLPAECRVVEVPVAARPVRQPHTTNHEPVFVHVAGHRAVGDRNGTLQLLTALRRMRRPCTVRLVTQDRNLPSLQGMRHSAVNVDLVTGGYPDRWSLYDDADLLVLPRRYGGLCLPVLEAFASGVGVVMTDVEPQASTWPIIGVPTPAARRPVEMPCGPVPLSTVDPTVLARLLDEMVDDPEQIIAARYRARSFAVEHSWARLRSMYEHEFDSALKSRV